jgi:acetolactate synthase-1/2/3 large subunit
VTNKLTTAALTARYLEAAGIRHVFGYPGDPNLEFMEQARLAGVQFVLARREGTAAFMADAYGQLTGLPGVCLSTLGPGSTNLVNGVATAFLDRSPMLALSGQMSTKLEPTFTHQNVDHVRLFAPIAKWATRMVPEAAGSILRKAFRVATAERPGPVHITTPINVGAAEATDSEIRLPPMAAVQDWPDGFRVDGAASPSAMLAKARRPAVVAGMAAARAKAGPALKALAEKAAMPVLVSPKGKGILSEDHPCFAGTVDMACNAHIWDFLDGCDLILAVGFDPVELIKAWRPKAAVIHIDAVPNTDQVYPAEVELVGSIPAILMSLADGYRGAAKWSEKEIGAHRDGLFRLYYEGRVDGKLNPTDVVDAARAAFPRETVVTMDVGSHKLLVGQGWTTYEPGTVLLTNGLSSMGFALPGALAAKLLRPQRPVVCFIGDGGFAMVESELQLAASLKLGIVVIVFGDNSLNRIELKQMKKQYPPVGTRFEASDLAKIAEAQGCQGARVETRAALDSVLADAKGLERPLVVDARIDPAQYLAQF